MDLLVDPGLPLVGAIGNWAEWLAIENTAEELDAIRTATARDSALGDEAFILWLESELGRSIRPQKRGRKRKVQDEKSNQGELDFGE
jgi:hypothetical protein